MLHSYVSHRSKMSKLYLSIDLMELSKIDRIYPGITFSIRQQTWHTAAQYLFHPPPLVYFRISIYVLQYIDASSKKHLFIYKITCFVPLFNQ